MTVTTSTTASTNSSAQQAQQALLAQTLAQLSAASPLTASANSASGVDSSQIGTQMGAITSTQAGLSNAASLTQTQEGYLQNISAALGQMGKLAEAAKDPSATDATRAQANQEFQALGSYIQSLTGKEFNGTKLFSSSALTVATDTNGGTLSMNGIDLTSGSYAAATSADLLTVGSATTGATGAFAAVQAALKEVTTDQTSLSSYQSQLGSADVQLAITGENLTAVTGSIQNSDQAETSTQSTALSILSQSDTATQAQANLSAENVLQLLQQ
jgi:flagellin